MGHKQGYRYNTGEIKRTLQEITEFQGSTKFCCIHPPLFDIDLDHVVLDELHLMIRITNRLTDCIITEGQQIRFFEKKEKRREFILKG